MRTIVHALRELRAYPGRAVLSGVSLMLGVFSLIAVTLIGLVAQEIFVAVSEQKEGRKSTYQFTAAAELSVDSFAEAQQALDSLRHSGGAINIAPLMTMPAHAGYPETYAGGQPLDRALLQYIQPDYRSIYRLPLLDGVWLDDSTDTPVPMVVNTKAAEQWGGPGTVLLVSPHHRSQLVTAVITGVIADGYPDPFLYLSLEPMLTQVPNLGSSFSELLVTIHHPQLGQEEIVAALEPFFTVLRMEVNPLSVVKVDRIDSIINSLQFQQAGFFAAGILMLVVSAVGILNIGLAGVSERKRELIIRRALGARRSDVFLQLLLAGSAVGVIAALISTAVIVVATLFVIPGYIPAETAIQAPGIPWHAIIIATVAAVATTTVATIIPAVAASRVDIAAELRA